MQPVARNDSSSAALRPLIEQWARELQHAAHTITGLVDRLPKNSSEASRFALEQEAIRLLAISAGMRTQLTAPDPIAVDLWRRLGRRSLQTLGVAIAAISVGGLEAAGADVWDALQGTDSHLQVEIAEPDEAAAPEPVGAEVLFSEMAAPTGATTPRAIFRVYVDDELVTTVGVGVTHSALAVLSATAADVLQVLPQVAEAHVLSLLQRGSLQIGEDWTTADITTSDEGALQSLLVALNATARRGGAA
jgi:hypothetical protein